MGAINFWSALFLCLLINKTYTLFSVANKLGFWQVTKPEKEFKSSNMRTRGQMHIYYTSKKPEVDIRCLEDFAVSLALLLGVLTYLFILFSLTAWLTKYHKYQYHGTDPKNRLDTREEYLRNQTFDSDTKDSKTTTSGEQSTDKD
jgi:hypothetical protein